MHGCVYLMHFGMVAFVLQLAWASTSVLLFACFNILYKLADWFFAKVAVLLISCFSQQPRFGIFNVSAQFVVVATAQRV